MPKIKDVKQVLYDCKNCGKENIPHYEIAAKEVSICDRCMGILFFALPKDVILELQTNLKTASMEIKREGIINALRENNLLDEKLFCCLLCLEKFTTWVVIHTNEDSEEFYNIICPHCSKNNPYLTALKE